MVVQLLYYISSAHFNFSPKHSPFQLTSFISSSAFPEPASFTFSLTQNIKSQDRGSYIPHLLKDTKCFPWKRDHNPWAALCLQGHESPSWVFPWRGLGGECTAEPELCTQRIKPCAVLQTVPPAASQLQAQGFSPKDIKSKSNINSPMMLQQLYVFISVKYKRKYLKDLNEQYGDRWYGDNPDWAPSVKSTQLHSSREE